MSWINRLFTQKEKSGSGAKQRLQMVLIHDRSDVSPGVLDQIKDDIIEVIAKRLAIDIEHVEVNLTQTGRESCLVAEIPLRPNGRRKTTSYLME